MKTNTNGYRGYRFPREIISHSVWLYHRFSLSFRDVEELLAKREIIVSYETVRQWCRKFGPEYTRKLKRRQGGWAMCGTWTRYSSRSGASGDTCGELWTKTGTRSTSWFSDIATPAQPNGSFASC